MRIQIVEEGNQRTQTSETGNNSNRIHIHPQENVSQEMLEITKENARLKRELKQKQESISQLQEELSRKQEKIIQLNRQLRAKEEQHLQQQAANAINQAKKDISDISQAEVTAEDLEDKDSIIEELRARNVELEKQLQQAGDNKHDNQEIDSLKQIVSSYYEEIESLDQKLSIQQDENKKLQSSLTNLLDQLSLEHGEGMITSAYLEEIQEKIEQHIRQAKVLKKQLKEAEQEEGLAFEQLQKVNLRYQQNMKYVVFYEKVPEKKIDGLELFRSQINNLDKQLSDLINNGLRKSYVFRTNRLVNELEENKEAFTNIMNELHSLMENYEFDGKVISDDVKTSEQSLREAEECLEELEKTLRNMHTVSEKFLRIKNIIGFDYDGY